MPVDLKPQRQQGDDHFHGCDHRHQIEDQIQRQQEQQGEGGDLIRVELLLLFFRDLFLFHFGYFDLGRIKARFEDPSRRAAGWTKHLERRSKTIRQVTEGKPKDWDRTTRFARILQTVCRPPYALNKPAMFELVLIVRIADRFRNLV